MTDLSEAFDDLKKAWANRQPPKARYNKNDKTITVSYGFDNDTIPVKIKAPATWWLDLDLLYGNTLPETITFETLEAYLNRIRKSDKTSLREYAAKWPSLFCEDLAWCVDAANAVNPLYPPRIKPRGKIPHGLSWERMNEIRGTARHLYVYLQHWMKQPTEKQPDEFKKCLRAYKLSEYEEHNPKIATMWIIEQVFDDFDIEKIEDPDTFYKKYIAVAHQPLSLLKKSNRILRGDSFFLAKVFKR